MILTYGIVAIETGESLTGTTNLWLATEAFTKAFGTFGGIFVAIAVTLFAFSTVLGGRYYGPKAWEYLFGTKATVVYKVIFLAVVLIGSTMGADLVIDLSDTFNGLMAIPNLIGVVSMSGTVVAITNDYCERTFKGKKDSGMLSHFPDIQKEHGKALREGR